MPKAVIEILIYLLGQLDIEIFCSGNENRSFNLRSCIKEVEDYLKDKLND